MQILALMSIYNVTLHIDYIQDTPSYHKMYYMYLPRLQCKIYYHYRAQTDMCNWGFRNLAIISAVVNSPPDVIGHL